jgi:NADPH-dependent 2,4-dienoyl-CoA reductase/sulfur reductase-like enzyme
MKLPLVIIGNGAAAAEAVLALRSHGYDGKIHLFADNHHAPYNPMLGTYLVSGAVSLEQAFPFGDERRFYGGNRVTTHLGEAIASLDPTEQMIVAADGTSYAYDRCLVACGARPAIPPVPGLREALGTRTARPGGQPGGQDENWRSGRRVFTMRTLADALELKAAVERLRARPGRPARAAILGASLVGVKVAATLRNMGLRVCLIERESGILPLLAHPECARVMETHLVEEGYELRMGATLTSVDMAPVVGAGRGIVRLDFGAVPGGASSHPPGEAACEDRAPHEDVDFVVVCTGTRPSLGFLTPGSVNIGQGILVDEQLRSSVPSLYAAGDVAQGRNLMSGRHEIIGLWASARYQGRAAGRSLAGVPARYQGSVPHNITHVGRLLFASVGCMHDYDTMAVCRDRDGMQVRVRQNGRLAGVNLLGCCLSAGTIKQAFLKAAIGATTEMEATWTSFNT